MTPILIPAKNIYRKHYEKLLDNVIQLVQVNAKNKKEQAYEETIYEDFAYYPVLNSSIEDSIYHGAKDNFLNYVILFSSIQSYTKGIVGWFERDGNLKYAEKANDFHIEVIAKIERGTVTGTVQDVNPDNPDEIEKPVIIDRKFVKTSETIEAISTFPTQETCTSSGVNLTVTLPKNESEKSLTSYIYQDKYVYTNFNFLCGVKRYNMSGQSELSRPKYLSGTYEYIIPQQIKYYIRGVVFKTEFIDETEMFGNTTSKQSYVVDGNELLTKDNYFTDYSQAVVDTPLPERYNTILEEYKNGKKKLTLLCDINDYYYYDATKPDKKGSIAISRNLTRLTFKEYDEVIPMIKLANGDYVPIAKNEDGTPMVFVVLAIRVFYDGVVWQELTLQQK